MGKIACLCLLAVLAPLPAPAAPPHPKLLREVAEGVRPEPPYLRRLKEIGPPLLRRRRLASETLREMGLIAPREGAPLAANEQAAAAPLTVGSPKVLALLGSFADVAGTVAPSFFDNLVFGSSGPSADHYFRETSGNTLDLASVASDLPSAVGWLSLPGTQSTYNTDDLRELISDMIAAADSSIDFSVYDNNGDGAVDYLILVHPGSGGELTGDGGDIWSRTVPVSPPIAVDGVLVDTFMTVPEYWYSPGDMTIGVYVHEFGHLLGLPDLYDADFDSAGIGNWGLMGHGMWNGPMDLGASPAWPCAWSRIALAWSVPQKPAANLDAVTIAPVETGGPVYLLWNGGQPGSEYFLAENRQQIGYDTALPHHGLLIWHVDDAMADNTQQVTSHADCNWPQHYLVALQQADGSLHLENNLNSGDSADPYPGTMGREAFTLDTVPNSGSYADCLSRVSILGIQENGTDILADLLVDSPADLRITAYHDRTPLLPGRTAAFTVTLLNRGAAATGISAVLSSSSPLVTITQGVSAYPGLAFTQEAAGSTPFQVVVAAGVAAGTLLPFELSLTADGGYAAVLSLPVVVEPSGVLLIDDDRNNPADYSSYLLDPLDALGRARSHWDYLAGGSPPLFLLERFPILLWTTGATFNGTITIQDEDLLVFYLRRGGSLAVSSEYYYYDRGFTWFDRDWLHIGGFSPDLYYTQVTGIPGSVISGGLGPYTLSFPFTNSTDAVQPDGQSVSLLQAPGGDTAALHYSSPLFRTAFFGFPLEALALPDRTEILAHLLPVLHPVPGDGSGRGFADLFLIRANDAGGRDLVVLESDGSSLAAPVVRGTLAAGDRYLLRGDVNGDGLGDLVRGRVLADNKVSWSVHLARWSLSGEGPQVVFEESAPTPWNPNIGSASCRFFLEDADGDGMADLIFAQRDPANPGRALWLVSRSTGQAFENPVLWSPGFGSLTGGTFLVGDVSGDGRADLVWGRARPSSPTVVRWRAALSGGNSFMPGTLWSPDAGNSTSRFYLGDVNGDGRQDLVFSNPLAAAGTPLRWKAALSSGTSFAAETKWAGRFGTTAWNGFGLCDLDGDGRADLVGWDKIGGQWVIEGTLSRDSAFARLGVIASFPSRAGDIIRP